MDTDPIDDSVFDFFSDAPKRRRHVSGPVQSTDVHYQDKGQVDHGANQSGQVKVRPEVDPPQADTTWTRDDSRVPATTETLLRSGNTDSVTLSENELTDFLNETYRKTQLLEYESPQQTSSNNISQVDELDDIYTSAECDYEDDFENMSSDSHSRREKYNITYNEIPSDVQSDLTPGLTTDTESSHKDSSTAAERQLAGYMISAERSPGYRASKNVYKRNKLSIHEQSRVSRAVGSRRNPVAANSHSDRPDQKYTLRKQRELQKTTKISSHAGRFNQNSECTVKGTIHPTYGIKHETAFSSDDSFSSSENGSFLGEYSGFNSYEDGIGTGLTYDSSETLLRNDRFSYNPASTSFLSKANDSRKMSTRNKLSLPHVDRSKRVQLTRNRKGRDKSSSSPNNQLVLRQPRTHAAMLGREIARPAPNSGRRPPRKPPVPIPLKSEALYCNGELTVNVRGDRRGNPDKNKFNVTITVVHKHARSHINPYRSRQPVPCRRRWRNDDLDLDIIKHRAALPGFNTATDPEVNRRYLQQFGL